MTRANITTKTLVAVLVAITAALIFRAWLQLELLQGGSNKKIAADLSYLVVPPILLFLLFPLWRDHKAFLASLFERSNLTWAMVYRAVAVGFLLRLFSWGHLIANVSFGRYQSVDPQAIIGPVFSFQCAAPAKVFLGFLVMAFMVPIIEEVVHRGIIVSFLRRRGPIIAIVLSSALFMIFHKGSSWAFVFLAGLVFGYQYWYSQSLWPSLFAHMTINGLIQIDWHCLSTQWNPVASDIPFLKTGILSICIMFVCVAGIIALLSPLGRGTQLRAPQR
jgi:membrane protease YdiL (CAAX protease family)